MLRWLMKKYKKRKRDLHMVFIDLKKTYDSIPRDIIWDNLQAKGVSMRYIEAIMDMYEEVMTNIQTPVG